MMSTNTTSNDKLEFKSNLPATVGDFWIKLADQPTKEIVRGFTRLNVISGEIDFASSVANKLTSNRFSNTGNISLTFEPNKVRQIGIGIPSYNTPEGEKSEPGLDRGLLNQAGVYGLDLATYRLWEDPNGLLWIFNTDVETFTPTASSTLITPKYAIEIGDIYPIMIISNNGYLTIGVDYELEGGNILFYEDPNILFSSYIHIVEGYENKVNLFGYPYSVDSDCHGVDYIATYLRGNNSVKNLENALSQVVGYDSFPTGDVMGFNAVPGGTSFVNSDGSASIIPQPLNRLNTNDGLFPGQPIKILTGSAVMSTLSHQLSLPLSYAIGTLKLYDKVYVCTIQDDFVSIDYGDEKANHYLNSARRAFENNDRFDTAGFPITTFSEYLKNKYAPSALNGEIFLVNILQEYFELYSDNILLVRLKNYLTDIQKSRAIDFLQTHTPSNAIIFLDESWE